MTFSAPNLPETDMIRKIISKMCWEVWVQSTCNFRACSAPGCHARAHSVVTYDATHCVHHLDLRFRSTTLNGPILGGGGDQSVVGGIDADHSDESDLGIERI